MTLVKERSFYRTFAALAGALILEQAVILSVNLADNLMIGNYSETALAAVAAVNMIQFVIHQITSGIAVGVTVLVSQYWGKKNMEAIRLVTGNGLRAELLFAALMFAAVSLFPEGCMRIFVEDPAIVAEGVRYLRVIRFTYPVFAVTTVFLGTMRSVETVHLALRVSVVSLVINICLNWLLIFGRLSAPEMGVTGAAVGTLAARAAECVIVLLYVFWKDRKLRLRPADLLRRDRALTGDYIRVAVPVMFQSAMWGIFNAVQSAILGHLTANAMTAYSISSTMFLLLKVASVGTCTAASILTGKIIGSGEPGKLKPAVNTMQLLFVGVGLILGGILFAVRIPLLNAYNVSEQTRQLADAFLMIQSVVLVTMSYQMPVNAGILRGGGDTTYLSILDFVSFWVIVVPVSWMAAFRWNMSPVAVVMFLNADQVFKGIPACLRVNRYRWVHNLTRADGSAQEEN